MVFFFLARHKRLRVEYFLHYGALPIQAGIRDYTICHHRLGRLPLLGQLRQLLAQVPPSQGPRPQPRKRAARGASTTTAE